MKNNKQQPTDNKNKKQDNQHTMTPTKRSVKKPNSLKPDLSLIILNHNGKKFLKSLLDSIKKQQNINIETIIVDNNSSDDSVSFIKNNFPWVKLIQRNKSEGFSAGNNLGVAHSQADYILFMNPDMKIPNKNTLHDLLEKYKSTDNIGVLTCRVNLADTNTIDDTCHRGFPTPWASFTYFSGLSKIFPKSKLFSQYLQSYKGYDTEHEVDSVGGMFILISRRIGDEIGWWDEDYPFYGEDIDLCYRVKQRGYKVYYWPKHTVLHYKGGTTGRGKHKVKVDKQKLRKVKSWSIDAMFIFYKKHMSKNYPWFINELVYLGIRLMKLKRMILS